LKHHRARERLMQDRLEMLQRVDTVGALTDYFFPLKKPSLEKQIGSGERRGVDILMELVRGSSLGEGPPKNKRRAPLYIC
jgi:hypothetical protein